MKRIIAVAIYMALALGAIPSHADTAAAALRTGDMKKLLFHKTPKPVPTVSFDLADGAGARSLQDYKGKYVLLNFWATWCAPCRHEMPMLSALQTQFGGDRFEVLTIATAELGEEDPLTIQTISHLAQLYEDTGRLEEALEQHRKVYELELALLGETHPNTAGGLNNMASVYRRLGEYEKAEKHFWI